MKVLIIFIIFIKLIEKSSQNNANGCYYDEILLTNNCVSIIDNENRMFNFNR